MACPAWRGDSGTPSARSTAASSPRSAPGRSLSPAPSARRPLGYCSRRPSCRPATSRSRPGSPASASSTTRSAMCSPRPRPSFGPRGAGRVPRPPDRSNFAWRTGGRWISPRPWTTSGRGRSLASRSTTALRSPGRCGCPVARRSSRSGPATAMSSAAPGSAISAIWSRRFRACGDCSTSIPTRWPLTRRWRVIRSWPALVAARPGLRSPGAVDGFELALRAIVGQQISVAGARTLLGRIAAEHGAADVRGRIAAAVPVRDGAGHGRGAAHAQGPAAVRPGAVRSGCGG